MEEEQYHLSYQELLQDIQELTSTLLEDVRNISEEFSEYINCPSWNRPLFYFDDDDDEYTVIWRRPKAITPDNISRGPEDIPLIMRKTNLMKKKLIVMMIKLSSDDDSFETTFMLRLSPPDYDYSAKEIEALNDNPTLSSFSYFDNSFSDHMEETRSGSTTTHADISLLEYNSFLFEIEPNQGGLSSVVISDNSNDPLLDFQFANHFILILISSSSFRNHRMLNLLNFEARYAPDKQFLDKLIMKMNVFDPRGCENGVFSNDEDTIPFTFVIQGLFSVSQTYLCILLYFSPPKNEDTIFDPGISSFRAVASHRMELQNTCALISLSKHYESPMSFLFHLLPHGKLNSGRDTRFEDSLCSLFLPEIELHIPPAHLESNILIFSIIDYL
ncbi:hypothetical protein Tco_0015083 [Tanacetum coccineum]